MTDPAQVVPRLQSIGQNPVFAVPEGRDASAAEAAAVVEGWTKSLANTQLLDQGEGMIQGRCRGKHVRSGPGTLE